MSDTPKPNNPTEELSHLGPYTIESRLGQGGMGIVYCATDKDLGRQVAIKVLHPHLLRHDNLKQRFRREARMHAKLMHPNIVTLLSLFEDGEHMALVMELVQGSDLKVYLRDNPNLPLKDKLNIAINVLAGLEASHQYGMVHRDLKPANVLVSLQGEVKLVDFGLAKPEEGKDDLTQSGATVGSFRYMAPEQILNKPIDARTDLYAFGILLFYMTVGKLPFDATSNGGEFEIMEKQVREPPASPHALNRKIPTSLSDLILQLLDKNKHNRPDSAMAVRDTIQDMLDQPEFSEEPSQNTSDKSSSMILNSPSNVDVAQQWIKHGQENFNNFKATTLPALKKMFSGLSGVAALFTLLGFIVIMVLNMAENTALQASVSKQEATTPVVEPATPVVAEKKVTPQPAEKNPIKDTVQPSKPKPVKEVAKPKVQPKKKPARKTSRLLTERTKHTVTRSDKTKVNTTRKHEFRSGNHQFYPGLAKKSWVSSYKRGESKLEFEKPVSVSKIILHKASVGRLDFKRGFIYLEIQAPNSSSWTRIFERKGDDVDIKVSINNIQKYSSLIQAVRIRFKTSEPITIGPIDLLP